MSCCSLGVNQLNVSMIIVTHSTNSHFGGATSVKVQFIFDIHLLEGQIHANAMEKWLKIFQRIIILLKKLSTKGSLSHFLSSPLASETFGVITMRDMSQMSIKHILGHNPFGRLLSMP